ncbi:hypothetical protein [Streptomyces sp. NPDC058623]|uniref:hypothetical protein n=1 Tax=Streptomyces sp. NPDC058623 TaxID=3346563 RepID=UPI00366289CB
MDPGEQRPAAVDPVLAAQEGQGAGVAVAEMRWGVAQEVSPGRGAVGVNVQIQRGVLTQQELLPLLRGVVVLVELQVPKRAGRLRDQDA